MNNETELHIASIIQDNLLEVINKSLKSDFINFTSDQTASVLISSIGIASGKAITQHLPGITRESFVKCMNLIHDCAISMWDLNEDKNDE
jgi:hypothetical protein